MEISDYMSLPIMEFKNNKATIALAVAVLATLFFCSVSLSDLVSAYGSLRGGGGSGFSDGGSGEGRILLLVEKQTYLLLILVVLLQVEKGSCLAQVVFK